METRLFESRLFTRGFSAIKHLFQSRRWHTTDGLEEPAVVEPAHPFERRELRVVYVLPGTSLSDEFCLEKADDGISRNVVIAVNTAAN